MNDALNQDNSRVMSLRVTADAREEFIALSRELGVQTARKLREVFDETLSRMRADVNDRRSIHGGEAWDVEWNRRKGDSNGES